MLTRDRFWSKVEIRGPDECWEWMGAKSDKGYGRFWVNDQMWAATRVAFILAHVEIPGGLLVLHTCDNPGCVNPDHLYAGTHKDNHLDMVTRNRAPTPNSMPGETNPGSKLTARGVKDIRKRYAAGGILQRQLAEEYGVAQTNISFIVRGEHWKHI